jgi:hypothetical protein
VTDAPNVPLNPLCPLKRCKSSSIARPLPLPPASHATLPPNPCLIHITRDIRPFIYDHLLRVNHARASRNNHQRSEALQPASQPRRSHQMHAATNHGAGRRAAPALRSSPSPTPALRRESSTAQPIVNPRIDKTTVAVRGFSSLCHLACCTAASSSDVQ